MKSISRLVLCCALVACQDATAPLPDAGVPSVLEFSIGGFGVGSSSVMVHGDTVLFVRVPWDFSSTVKLDTVRVVPTTGAWRGFWTAANGAGVSRWHAEYHSNGILDGVGWGLRLVTNGRELTSSGSNAYPDRSGSSHEGDFTPEFRAFLAAFDQLVGQKVF